MQNSNEKKRFEFRSIETSQEGKEKGQSERSLDSDRESRKAGIEEGEKSNK